MTNGTRREWGLSVTPRPLFTPGKDPVSIVQQAGWAPGPVWTGAENLAPTGIRSPDIPTRSQLFTWMSVSLVFLKFMPSIQMGLYRCCSTRPNLDPRWRCCSSPSLGRIILGTSYREGWVGPKVGLDGFE